MFPQYYIIYLYIILCTNIRSVHLFRDTQQNTELKPFEIYKIREQSIVKL